MSSRGEKEQGPQQGLSQVVFSNKSRPSLPTSMGILLKDYGDFENLPLQFLTPPTPDATEIADQVSSILVSGEDVRDSKNKRHSKSKSKVGLRSRHHIENAENTPVNGQNVDSKLNIQSRHNVSTEDIGDNNTLLYEEIGHSKHNQTHSRLRNNVPNPIQYGDNDENTPLIEQTGDLTRSAFEKLPPNKQIDDTTLYLHYRRPSPTFTGNDVNDIENEPICDQNEVSKWNLRSRSKIPSEVISKISGEWSYEEGSSKSTNMRSDTSAFEIPTSFENYDDISHCYDYGEPSRYQHLQFDFTPIEGIDDDEELFQKCVSFWNFVNSRPEFTEILVKPDEGEVIPSFVSSQIEEIAHKNNEIEVAQVKSGMQWTADLPLQYLGKLSLQYCEDPPLYYKHSSDKTPASSGGSSTRFWAKSKKDIVEPPTYDQEQTRKLIAAMEDFDEKHPKCFEPPRTITRSLITAEMKRLPPLSYPPLYPD